MATGWTDAGLAAVTTALGTTFWLAVGTGTTAYARTQTALVTESSASGLARAAATVTRVTTTVANDSLQGSKTWTCGVAGPVVIAEVGWFDAASAGNMYSRSLLAATRSMLSSDTYTMVFKLVFAI